MDIVEASNLQRQIIHGTNNVGELKIESAKRSISRINPFVDVKIYQDNLAASDKTKEELEADLEMYNVLNPHLFGKTVFQDRDDIHS